MIIGRQLIERMYSENDYYEDTKLYSTGDSELDDLLERAFCEGYEYAQKEFAAYKSPISQEQAGNLVKDANAAGIKGKSVAMVGKNWIRKSLAELKELGCFAASSGVWNNGPISTSKPTSA